MNCPQFPSWTAEDVEDRWIRGSVDWVVRLLLKTCACPLQSKILSQVQRTEILALRFGWHFVGKTAAGWTPTPTTRLTATRLRRTVGLM